MKQLFLTAEEAKKSVTAGDFDARLQAFYCAAGDALGYIVEFMHYRDIRQTFGPQGIMEYELVNE